MVKEKSETTSDNLDEDTFETVDPKNLDDDLVMDVLPKSTRFRAKVSLSSFTQFNLDNSDDLSNEFFDDSTEQEVVLYIQKNSKLSLVSMCLDTSSDKYRPEFIVNIVSLFLITMHFYH